MKRKRTPQEKKQLSYERDCRNTSGESNRVAQKAVKKEKNGSENLIVKQ